MGSWHTRLVYCYQGVWRALRTEAEQPGTTHSAHLPDLIIISHRAEWSATPRSSLFDRDCVPRLTRREGGGGSLALTRRTGGGGGSLALTRRTGGGGEFGANEAHGGGGGLALTRRTGGGGFGANEAHGGGEFGANEAHGGGGGSLALTRRTGGGGVWR